MPERLSMKGDSALRSRFAGRVLGVATLHAKERVIGPALLNVLSVRSVRSIADVDTDRFGAFSGEVERTLDPLETCIAKAKHGAEVSGLDLVIASEGSFGPYPPAPFISCDEELLVLYDARDGAVFTHKHVALETVHGGEEAGTIREVLAFAERMQFPEHHLVLRPREKWRKGDAIYKGVNHRERLIAFAEELFTVHGKLWVETDMRAMSNPTRMNVIKETAERFAAELGRLCPICGECWFHITGTRPGLPCSLCGWPTESILCLQRCCWRCNHAASEPRPDGKLEEDPQHCGNCNP